MTSAAPPLPVVVNELSDFSTQEVLGRTCQALLEYTQSQTHTLQAQPLGEEVTTCIVIVYNNLSLSLKCV